MFAPMSDGYQYEIATSLKIKNPRFYLLERGLL
jgi:hypothetical protein